MTEKISSKINLLLEANYILSSTLDFDRLLTTIMELAAKVVDAEVASLMLLDESGQELSFQVALGEKGTAVKKIRLKLGEGIAGWVAKEGEPLIVKDVSKDSRWAATADAASQFITRSIICLPLKIKEKIIGVVEAINHRQRGYFDSQDLPFFQAFASQAAVAIENARLFQNLNLEKEKIETIFQEMSDGVIFADAGRNIFTLNRAAGLFFELPAPQLIGKKIDFIFRDFDIRPSWEEIFSNRLEKYFTCRISRKGKSEKTLHLSGLVNRITGGNNISCGYIFILRDSTEEYKETLLKRTFLSLISHKLKTPLTAISGYLSLLVNGKQGESLSVFQSKAIATSFEQTKLLTALVNQLLNFTLIEGENLELKVEKVRWGDLVKETKQMVAATLPLENVVLIWEKEEAEFILLIDLVRTADIFQQLFDNAIKFNNQVKKEIRVSPVTTAGNKFLQICVADNGKGLPPEEREKIFQKFYQIEEYFTGQVIGAGLGLALVKRLIEAQGGNIWVESKSGEGSKFFFTLPLS